MTTRFWPSVIAWPVEAGAGGRLAEAVRLGDDRVIRRRRQRAAGAGLGQRRGDRRGDGRGLGGDQYFQVAAGAAGLELRERRPGRDDGGSGVASFVSCPV